MNARRSEDSCVSCCTALRYVKKDSIRSINANTREIYSNLLGKEVKLNDQICGKCRLELFKTRRETNAGVSDASNELVLDNETVESSQNSQKSSTSINSEGIGSDLVVSQKSSDSDPTWADDIHLDEPAKDIETVLLPYGRTVATHAYCILCGSQIGTKLIPFEARLQVFIQKRIYIPHGNRCCASHLIKSRFYLDMLVHVRQSATSSEIPNDEVSHFLETLTSAANSSLFDEFVEGKLSDERLHALTGFGWNTIDRINQLLISMRDSSKRETVQAIIVFLLKLRTGNSNRIIAAILNIENEQTISTYFNSVLNAFTQDVLPNLFGYQAYSREFLINEHTSPTVRTLFKITGSQLVLVCDGTYVRHQKSSNNYYQRKSYSGHKKQHLAKPFTICTTDGFVVDVAGPYEATKNDSEILKDILAQPVGLSKLIRKGDVFILDRGFRDVKPFLEELGLVVYMPALKGAAKQLTTEEANYSRFVTKCRWVVEAVHGVIAQKYRLLHHQYDNKMLTNLGSLCKIACFLLNSFGRPFNCNESGGEIILNHMINRRHLVNNLNEEVESERWARRKVPFISLNSTELLDFPEMTTEELKILFTGMYQLGQAISYLAEIVHACGGVASICVNLLSAEVSTIGKLLKVEIQSRHRNNTKYKCFVKYHPNKNGLDGILGYSCTCANGRRTVGTCAHIAAIIYYLSNGRYERRILAPNEILTSLFAAHQDQGALEAITIASDSEED